jgi:type IV pilus assembly protein PilQ
MIMKVDVPVDQILIEARLVEASDTFGKSLGVKLGGMDLRSIRGGDGGYQIAGNTRAVFGSSYSNSGISSGFVQGATGSGTGTDTPFVNFPAGGLTSAPNVNPASLALSIFDATANRMLNLEISALEADGKGKVVSSPRVVTSNQKQASIENGYRIPYTKAGINGGPPTTEFVPATLKLLVTPQTTPDGRIILVIEVNKDEPFVALGAGATKTKSIKTEVLVENGGTVVIGGIFEETKDVSETKVPLLGDIPYLGNLFKSKTTNTTKQELLIFITPKLLTDRAIGQ